jgi:hypothetical protein
VTHGEDPKGLTAAVERRRHVDERFVLQQLCSVPVRERCVAPDPDPPGRRCGIGREVIDDRDGWSCLAEHLPQAGDELGGDLLRRVRRWWCETHLEVHQPREHLVDTFGEVLRGDGGARPWQRISGSAVEGGGVLVKRAVDSISSAVRISHASTGPSPSISLRAPSTRAIVGAGSKCGYVTVGRRPAPRRGSPSHLRPVQLIRHAQDAVSIPDVPGHLGVPTNVPFHILVPPVTVTGAHIGAWSWKTPSALRGGHQLRAP